MVHQQLVLGTALLLPSLIFVKFYAVNHDDALFYMGYTCGTASILAYGSPLSAMVSYYSYMCKQQNATILQFLVIKLLLY